MKHDNKHFKQKKRPAFRIKESVKASSPSLDHDANGTAQNLRVLRQLPHHNIPIASPSLTPTPTTELDIKKRKRKRQNKEYDEDKISTFAAAAVTSSFSSSPSQSLSLSSNSGSAKKPQSVTTIPLNSRWNFAADYNDHFETPKKAYEDLSVSILDFLLPTLQKTRENAILYDPYYCQGNMIPYLQQLSYQHIINQNQDFYGNIRQKKIPNYDILITNPPYSGEHKMQLFQYLSSALHQNRPFAILLPVYVVTKSYWKDFLLRNQANQNHGVLYMLPSEYYEYLHPENTGKDIPPFYSIWIVGNLPSTCISSILQNSQNMERKAFSPNNAFSIKRNNPQLPPLTFTQLKIVSSIEEISHLKLITEKRPNPKQRKKLKAKFEQR